MEGIEFNVSCISNQNKVHREVKLKFPFLVRNEILLKSALILIAVSLDRIADTAVILSLPFGRDYTMPVDLLFNNVPHASWVRAYLYNEVTAAVVGAVLDPGIKNKSRLQLKVNFPVVQIYTKDLKISFYFA